MRAGTVLRYDTQDWLNCICAPSALLATLPDLLCQIHATSSIYGHDEADETHMLDLMVRWKRDHVGCAALYHTIDTVTTSIGSVPPFVM
jgi:hypothetical protein